ncbi:MAG: hypothetical protein WDN75_07135 [Bacteroidota bacterium]
MAQAYTVTHQYSEPEQRRSKPAAKSCPGCRGQVLSFEQRSTHVLYVAILDKGREPLRRKLADLAGVSGEEIAINRNTTEALGTFTWESI